LEKIFFRTLLSKQICLAPLVVSGQPKNKQEKGKRRRKKMRKYFFSLLVVAAVTMAAGVAFAQVEGYSTEQVGCNSTHCWVHKDLVVEGNKMAPGDPTFRSGFTGWGRDLQMEIIGNFWVVKLDRPPMLESGRFIRFNFQLGYANYWLPNVLVDEGVSKGFPAAYSGNGKTCTVVNVPGTGYDFVGPLHTGKTPF